MLASRSAWGRIPSSPQSASSRRCPGSLRPQMCWSVARAGRRAARWQALIVATSHGVLGNESCSTCKQTGATSPEFAVSFLIFMDAGDQEHQIGW